MFCSRSEWFTLKQQYLKWIMRLHLSSVQLKSIQWIKGFSGGVATRFFAFCNNRLTNMCVILPCTVVCPHPIHLRWRSCHSSHHVTPLYNIIPSISGGGFLSGLMWLSCFPQCQARPRHVPRSPQICSSLACPHAQARRGGLC